MCIFKRREKKEYRKEYIQLMRRLRNRQLKATALFILIKDDPVQNAGYKQELDATNQEANALAIRIIELEQLMK